MALVGVFSLGAGAFGSSSPFFFFLLRVTCVHSLLFSSGVALVASVVLVVVSLEVSLVVSVVLVILMELLVLLISAFQGRCTKLAVL